ncbi:glycosyl transferase, group 1 [Streptomyces griseoaurantiacus M045]|uniref:D-inositol 3-phosphate glycosyltransferase n=1 Tax=Streptomyces griseoaurantiacus M045 TaxID=996637 RepID=F3NPV8_9ACTN|nr:glycosyltransferase [Streptomyces griseoaurantiacus]EGG44628.1 glycosyl transferase, group 1 [Streptomyces griseoaurantiacus M045]
MRIAMVSEHASPLAALGGPDAGGQNVYVARLAEELTRRGHQVTVYTRRDAATLPERVPLPGGAVVEHVTAGPAEPIPKDELLAHMPVFGAHLARAWARERDRPEVVHAHFWMSGIAARLGAHPHGIPVVQTFHALGTVKRRHQGAADTSPPERIGVERGLGRTCDRVLATCSDEVRELAAMGVPRRRVAVVPCGVDADHFRPDPGRVLSGGTASGGPWRPPERRAAHRLLAIGRLVPRKGYDQAVRALPRIPDTELLLAGGPPEHRLAEDTEAGRLLRLAGELGVADRVRLLGAVDPARMPDLMRATDLVLCTPAYEPFGIVPLEAMACGVPVVATDVGGHRDSVADRVTGRLVPPGDPGAVAAAVRELLDDTALRRRYGAAGRDRVLARFTWQRVALGAEQVYRQVAADRELRTEVA